MKTKEQIYDMVRENIKKCISDDWDKAILEINVAPNFSSYKGYYYVRGEKRSIKVSKFDLSLDNELIDLHKITTNIEKLIEKWNRANFTLFNNDMYEIEFVWDQEHYDNIYGNNI
jgi:hypothetical protein